MASDFWARKIGGIAQPQPQQAPPQQYGPPQPAQGGAWWQQPQYGDPQQYQQPQQGQPNQALQAQMGYAGQVGPQGMPLEQYIKQLKRVPADQLNQEQMEEIAQFELDNDRKYNQVCPNCGSGNFVAAGTVISNKRMGSDKCFDCGASSSTYTSSPEPAAQGRGNSKLPYKDIRQIDTGGAGGASMYLKFNGVPSSYVPRGA